MLFSLMKLKKYYLVNAEYLGKKVVMLKVKIYITHLAGQVQDVTFQYFL